MFIMTKVPFSGVRINMYFGVGMEAHDFNSNTQEAEVTGSLSLSPSWFM